MSFHTLTCFNYFLHCLIVSIAKVLCPLSCDYLATLKLWKYQKMAIFIIICVIYRIPPKTWIIIFLIMSRAGAHIKNFFYTFIWTHPSCLTGSAIFSLFLLISSETWFLNKLARLRSLTALAGQWTPGPFLSLFFKNWVYNCVICTWLLEIHTKQFTECATYQAPTI